MPPLVVSDESDSPIDLSVFLPLVGHLVHETLARVPAHVERDDLTSAGMMALVQAGRSFQPERGVPFERYAARRIRGAILDELRAADWASRRVRRTAREIEAARSQLATALGHSPSDQEVADTLGVRVEDVIGNDDDVQRAHVLSFQGSALATVEEMLPSKDWTPEQQAMREEEFDLLKHAIAELPDRLRATVEGYFLHERPMSDLAAELGVTDSRISQMRAEALTLLRGALHFVSNDAAVTPQQQGVGVAERRRRAYYEAVAVRVRRPAVLRLAE